MSAPKGRSKPKRVRASSVKPYRQQQEDARRRFWDGIVDLAQRERMDDAEDQGYLLVLAGLLTVRGEGVDGGRLALLVQHAIDESERQAAGQRVHMVKGGDA